MKWYRITRIEEPDFGCEGRPEGQAVMDDVWLEDENGVMKKIQAEDALLYEKDLNEGDQVVFDEEGKLKKYGGKLAVIFPGIGYHVDKPLLYYAKQIARSLDYEVKEVPYGNFPKGVKGAPKKMEEAFYSALSQTEEILKDVVFSDYDEVLFISKSVGTAVSAAFAKKYNLKAAHILYTPMEATFTFAEAPGMVFHGNKDSWVETEIVIRACEEKALPLHVIEGANHSLETGNVDTDLQNLRKIMEATREFMQGSKK